MVHAPVIPNSDIVGVLPLEAHLEVVVLDNKLSKPVEEMLALLLGQPIDALTVVADSIHRFPARDGVGTDDRVDGLEGLADVLGRATLATIYAEAVALGCLVEERLGVVGGQCVEEGAQRGRDAVVQLVAGGPERVTARLGQLHQPQESVVGGDGFEGDVGMPLIFGALAAGADSNTLVREPVLV